MNLRRRPWVRKTGVRPQFRRVHWLVCGRVALTMDAGGVLGLAFASLSLLSLSLSTTRTAASRGGRRQDDATRRKAPATVVFHPRRFGRRMSARAAIQAQCFHSDRPCVLCGGASSPKTHMIRTDSGGCRQSSCHCFVVQSFSRSIRLTGDGMICPTYPVPLVLRRTESLKGSLE